MGYLLRALGWSAQLDGKSPLLKDNTAWLQDINLELSCKLLHYWLAFTVPEGVMPTTRVEKSFMDLPSSRRCTLQH